MRDSALATVLHNRVTIFGERRSGEDRNPDESLAPSFRRYEVPGLATSLWSHGQTMGLANEGIEPWRTCWWG